MKKQKLNFLLLTAAFVFLSGNAFAQLFIEDGKIKKTVAPGQTYVDRIVAHNSSDTPVDVRVYLEDFEYEAPFDGTKKFYPAATRSRSSSSWISFEPRQFQLEPYARQEVRFTVNVPREAAGGYYSVMFFERQNEQQEVQGQIGIKIVSRVGSLLFFETDDRLKRVSFSDVKFDGNVLTARIMNTGNTNLVARCLYYVLDKDSIPVDRGEIGPFYFSQENQTDIAVSLLAGMKPGNYTAVLTFDLEDGVSAVHEINFAVDRNGVFQKI